MIKAVLLGSLIGILIAIILLLIIKVIKLRRIINKRINGEELTLGDLREFNTWVFSSFGVDERINQKGNRIFVVYRFLGLFGGKYDFEEYDNLSEAIQNYTTLVRNRIDKIIYNHSEKLWL